MVENTEGRPSPILLFILIELSNKIKILAGKSPSPEPGGNGFALANWLKFRTKINVANISKNLLILLSKFPYIWATHILSKLWFSNY